MKDAFDQWWEWAEKPVDSSLTISADIYNPVMGLSEEDRRHRAKINEAVRRYQDEETKKAAVQALDRGRMRMLTLAILLIGAVSVTAHAQTYDPNYPVCLQKYGLCSYIDCSYTSLAQCNASASGRAAQCLANPYFAQAYRPRRRR
jgi:hypothetical protein